MLITFTIVSIYFYHYQALIQTICVSIKTEFCESEFHHLVFTYYFEFMFLINGVRFQVHKNCIGFGVFR